MNFKPQCTCNTSGGQLTCSIHRPKPKPIPAKQGEGLAKVLRNLVDSSKAALSVINSCTPGGTEPPPTEESLELANLNRDDVRRKLSADIRTAREALANLTEQDEVCSTCDGAKEIFIKSDSDCDRWEPCPDCSQAPPLDEWQPIESVPNGERVMLATEHIAHPGTVYNALGDEKFVWLPPQVHDKPTHWKPIGNLPNAGDEGQEVER